MFNNIKSTGTSKNKIENVLTSGTNAVQVKVERESGDEVQQREIDLYKYMYHALKEEMAVGHEVLQYAVYSSNCPEDKITGTRAASQANTAEPSQNHNSNNRNGSIIKLETEAMSAVREEPTEELYADHEIKDEMVIGPVVLQAVTYMMEENGETVPKTPRLETRHENTEPDNTAKQTRTETNTEEMTSKDCNESTEPSDTKPMENVKNKIPTRSSKHRNNTQINIKNDKNNKRTVNMFQCNDCGKQYDKKSDLARHIEIHDRTKRDIYFKCKECTYQSVTQCSLERHLKLHDKSRRFVCDVCGYRYMVNTQLQEHLRCVHSDEKIHRCCICDYKTNYISHLNRHLRIHSGEKPFLCSQCGYKCSQNSNLEIHSRIHKGEKPYSCSLCEFKCSVKSDLKKHSRIHTGEKHYSCSLCEFKCSDKGSLRKHSLIHTGVKPYSCNYKCSDKSNLKRHLRTHSEPLPKKPRLNIKDKTTEPDNTAKQTRTETNSEEMTPKENTESLHRYTEPVNDKKLDLVQHIESHDEIKRDIYLKCKECAYQSVTQRSLERHLKLHDKSRRFVCDVCAYRYTDNTRLLRHLRNIHSVEKIYECGICDYKTNIIGHIKIHLRIHSSEMRYSCSVCKFKCSQKSYLKRHSLIHTGEKPYSCSECNYKSTQSGNLKQHQLRTHSK